MGSDSYLVSATSSVAMERTPSFYLSDDVPESFASKLVRSLPNVTHDPSSASIAIFAEFAGPLFKELRGRGCTVLGLLFIYSLLKESGKHHEDKQTMLRRLRSVLRSRKAVYSRALEGCVVCSTGLLPEKRDELQQYVEYMNGEWTNQFQTNVTILVAEHSGSPKFVTALERNVAIVKPEWIGSCWAEGKRLPFPTYSFAPAPIFSGCVIVTSGLTAELRERVRRETEERGGTYLGNLTTNCTHLITTQQQGAKFEKAITLPCHIVRLDWFHECVRDSMRKCEADFYWAPGLFGNCVMYLHGCDAASAEQLAELITRNGGTVAPVIGPQVTHVIVGCAIISVDAKVVAHCRAGAAAVTETWVHDCVKLDSKLPWAGRYEAPLEQPCPASPDSAVLHGVSFFALGFDDEQLAELEHVITRVGGTVYADARNEAAVGVRYVLTPHGYVLPRRLQLRLSAPRVSPMWLERTLATQRLLEPSEFVAFSPLPHPTPLAALQSRSPPIKLTLTGFTGEARANLVALIKILGFRFGTALEPTTNVLLCSEAHGNKYLAALRWHIPVVKQQWLIDCALQGVLLEPDGPYLLSPTVAAASHQQRRHQHLVADDGHQHQHHHQPPPPTFPLAGVSIIINPSLSEYRQLKETAAFLGASVVTKYFEGLTHYVTIGVASDREFRAARANNCAIVSPLWLVKCKEADARLHEADYPFEVDPRRTLLVDVLAPVSSSERSATKRKAAGTFEDSDHKSKKRMMNLFKQREQQEQRECGITSPEQVAPNQAAGTSSSSDEFVDAMDVTVPPIVTALAEQPAHCLPCDADLTAAAQSFSISAVPTSLEPHDEPTLDRATTTATEELHDHAERVGSTGVPDDAEDGAGAAAPAAIDITIPASVMGELLEPAAAHATNPETHALVSTLKEIMRKSTSGAASKHLPRRKPTQTVKRTKDLGSSRPFLRTSDLVAAGGAGGTGAISTSSTANLVGITNLGNGNNNNANNAANNNNTTDNGAEDGSVDESHDSQLIVYENHGGGGGAADAKRASSHAAGARAGNGGGAGGARADGRGSQSGSGSGSGGGGGGGEGEGNEPSGAAMAELQNLYKAVKESRPPKPQSPISRPSPGALKKLQHQPPAAVVAAAHRIDLSGDDDFELDGSPSNIRCFVLTGMKDDDKQRLRSMVLELGGVVYSEESTTRQWMDGVTHVIADKPSRSVSYLGGVAGGRWVLQPAYLEDSYNAGRWLEEHSYEWDPEVANEASMMGLAAAAKYWRLTLQSKQQPRQARPTGAFSDFRVIVHTSVRRTAYVRLVQAGRGVVENYSETLPLHEITHAFFEGASNDESRAVIRELQQAKVSCLSVRWLSEYLISPAKARENMHKYLFEPSH